MSSKLSVFLFYSLTTFNFSLQNDSDSNLTYVSFPANENGTCYKRVPYDDDLAVKVSSGLVNILPGSQKDGVKTGSSRSWVTIIDCCEDYVRKASTGKCDLQCDDGWRPEAGVCKPICRSECPQNAYCFSPEICSCKFGFEEVSGSCRPVCLHCQNGDCIAPRVCNCHSGFFLNKSKICEPFCEGDCSHGRCESPGICTCYEGYENPPNNQKSCVPRCLNCINGECHSPDVCTCKAGFIHADNGTCVPRCINGCPNGQCVAPERCACNRGFVMSPRLLKCVDSVSRVQNTVMHGRIEDYFSSRANKSNHFNGPMQNESLNGTYGIVHNRGVNEEHIIRAEKPMHGNYGNDQPQNPYVVSTDGNLNERNSTYGRDPYGNYKHNLTYNSRLPTNTQEFTNVSGWDKISHLQNRSNIHRNNDATYVYQRSDFPHESNLRNMNNSYTFYDNNRPHKIQGLFPPLEANQSRHAQVEIGERNPSLEQIQESYSPTDRYGIKNTHRRPINEYLYRNRSVSQIPEISRINSSYKTNEMLDPLQNSDFVGSRDLSQSHVIQEPTGDPVIHDTHNAGLIPIYETPETYNTYSHMENYGRRDSTNRGQNTFAENQSVCSMPCVNGKCVGTNQCECNYGYVPDLRNPFHNTCIPACFGGCLNGICVAPNRCICNFGFVKEFNIQGTNNCVPINPY